MIFVYGARSVNISCVAIHHCVYSFIFIIVLILGGLIVCIVSSIYCQAFVKQKWHCHIVSYLLAVYRTILGLSIAMVKVMPMFFQMRLNFLRGVPSRLRGVPCYYISKL